LQVQALLRSAVVSRQWTPLKLLCGSDPVILGRCTFELEHDGHQPPRPSVDLYIHTDEFVRQIRLCETCYSTIVGSDRLDIIYYYRHGVNSLRFYSLDILPFDTASRSEGKSSLPRTLVQGQFAGFNSTVVHQARLTIHSCLPAADDLQQFNSSKMLESMVQMQSSEHDNKLWMHCRRLFPVQLRKCLLDFSWRCSTWVSVILCSFCHAISVSCNVALPVLSPSHSSLKDLSATGMSFFPAGYPG